MSPHYNEQLQKAGRLDLSISAIKSGQILSIRKAERLYDNPETSLRRRLKGAPSIAQSNIRKRKLSPIEERSLADWILELHRRGFPPPIIDEPRLTNTLLAACGQQPAPDPVGKCWATRSIKAQSEL